ncbi:glycosyltransferase [Lactobacillus gasseri]|uniref:glycosyltransferase n=1 Tax=Lactobacillus gasseri TaxID=1596 RepID=UPI0011981943|nr:glycosyltransferase [Lactobacillus gasseri]TVV15624.1 glycosyltransferase family 1 protein [Lactobacillus gasseri]
MIRILHSELQENIGGIESFLLNLTKTIDMNDIQFDMLMRGNNNYLENELKKYGVKIYKVPTNSLEYLQFIKRVLNKNKYDIVHIHKNSAANIILPQLVKKYSNAKLVIHSHNTSPSSGSKLGSILHKINYRHLLRLSDCRLACSDTAAQWLFGKDYAKKNVTIIKNGIISSLYTFDLNKRKKIRKELGLEDKFVIGHVGAFRMQKNHKFLIDLIATNKISNVRLVLVGKGELKKEIELYAKEKKVQDKILFLGGRNDVYNVLQGFDVFVMPSLWEGLPVSTIEAQASGLPLILSAQVSRLTKITPSVFFLNLDNLNQWIKKINELKNDFKREDESEFIKKAGYDMSSSAKEIKKIYLNILQ